MIETLPISDSALDEVRRNCFTSTPDAHSIEDTVFVLHSPDPFGRDVCAQNTRFRCISPKKLAFTQVLVLLRLAELKVKNTSTVPVPLTLFPQGSADDPVWRAMLQASPKQNLDSCEEFAWTPRRMLTRQALRRFRGADDANS